MTPEQEQKLNEVYEFMQQLRDSHTIPKDVGDALSTRIGGFDATLAGSPAAYLRAVNEGGADTYNVLSEPTQMIRIKVGNASRLVPDYS